AAITGRGSSSADSETSIAGLELGGREPGERLNHTTLPLSATHPPSPPVALAAPSPGRTAPCSAPNSSALCSAPYGLGQPRLDRILRHTRSPPNDRHQIDPMVLGGLQVLSAEA